MIDLKKFYDSNAAIQVIGSIYNRPSILDNEGTYFFFSDDFQNDFHRVVFGTMYDLYSTGTKRIDTLTIEKFLQSRPESYGIYKANGGSDWVINTASVSANPDEFDYYYGQLKKVSLLREYAKMGLDTSWLYDFDNLDGPTQEKQQKKLDSLTVADIADIVDKKLISIRERSVDNTIHQSQEIGEGLRDLLADLKEKPAVGMPLYDKVSSTVFMGARQGKFYIRSAATGVGNMWSF